VRGFLTLRVRNDGVVGIGGGDGEGVSNASRSK